jgi:hypothetical protein
MPSFVRWLIVLVGACAVAMLLARLFIATAEALRRALPAIAFVWVACWILVSQLRARFRR